MKYFKLGTLLVFLFVLTSCANGFFLTEDAKEFMSLMDQIDENYALEDKYNIDVNTTIKLFDEDGVEVTRVNSYSSVYYDESNQYFHEFVMADGDGDSMFHVVDGSSGDLINYNIQFGGVDYEVITKESKTSDFVDYLADFAGSEQNLVIGYKDIKQINDYRFEITLEMEDLFNYDDLYAELEDAGISGMDGKEILLYFTFDQDGKGYLMNFDINDLNVEIENDDYTMDIIVNAVYKIDEAQKIRIEGEGLFYYLPTSKDDIILTTPSDIQTTYYIKGSTDSWIRLYLEPQFYQININGSSYNTEWNLFDENNNEIIASPKYVINEAGYYYVVVHGQYPESIDFNIYANPDPIIIEVDLNNANGQAVFYKLLENDIYQVNFPVFDSDRILQIEIYDEFGIYNDNTYFEFISSIDHTMSNHGCSFNQENVPCYFYLPANTQVSKQMIGSFTGPVKFDYTYFEIPQSNEENIYQVSDLSNPPAVILNGDLDEATLTFTLTEDTWVTIDPDFYLFGYATIDFQLYNSAGTAIFMAYPKSLAAGDYILKYFYNYDYNKTLSVICTKPLH